MAVARPAGLRLDIPPAPGTRAGRRHLLLGGRIPQSPQGAEQVRLRLLGADQTFPDGTAELVYTPT
jgi:hypothetical protein